MRWLRYEAVGKAAWEQAACDAKVSEVGGGRGVVGLSLQLDGETGEVSPSATPHSVWVAVLMKTSAFSTTTAAGPLTASLTAMVDSALLCEQGVGGFKIGCL